jgi:hypothetical protein
MSEHHLGPRLLIPIGNPGQRLAAVVVDIAPEAVAVRVTPPHSPAGHVTARAYSHTGQRVELPRASARAIGRWIVRAHPETDWTEPRAFDVTGTGLARRPMSSL